MISEQSTYTVEQWAHSLLTHLYLTDWDLSKTIVSNYDSKFLSELWKVLFRKLDVSLFYTTAYHSQADNQSKQTNQIVKIVLYFYLNIMTKATEWSKSLLFIQSNLNNIKSNFISKMLNKTVYEFSLNIIFTLNIAAESVLSLSVFQIEVTDVVDFTKINIKYHYNQKHQPLVMQVSNYALLQLHHEYSILTITNKKLKQQYVEFFQIIDWIDQLVYKLDILPYWCVHSVFTVAQLELCSSLKNNFFNHSHSEESFIIFIKENTESWKFFKLKRLLN